MGGSYVITFDPGDRDPDTVETELCEAIEQANLQKLGEDEKDDPNVWSDEENVYWRYFPGRGVEPINELDIDCARVVTIETNDTVGTGHARFFEYIDGQFYETDRYGDNRLGRRVVDYFAIEYGLEAKRE